MVTSARVNHQRCKSDVNGNNTRMSGDVTPWAWDPALLLGGWGSKPPHSPPPILKNLRWVYFPFFFTFFFLLLLVCLFTYKKKKLLRTTMGTPHNPTKPLTPGELHDPFPQPRSHFHDPGMPSYLPPSGQFKGFSAVLRLGHSGTKKGMHAVAFGGKEPNPWTPGMLGRYKKHGISTGTCMNYSTIT